MIIRQFKRLAVLVVISEHIRNLPIPIAPKCEMDALTTLAKEELKQHLLLKEAKLESDRGTIQATIDTLDSKIDELVYKIYGVNENEKPAIDEKQSL